MSFHLVGPCFRAEHGKKSIASKFPILLLMKWWEYTRNVMSDIKWVQPFCISARWFDAMKEFHGKEVIKWPWFLSHCCWLLQAVLQELEMMLLKVLYAAQPQRMWLCLMRARAWDLQLKIIYSGLAIAVESGVCAAAGLCWAAIKKSVA